jgi:drug/metabolite transporter (DMT)-like permease
MFAELGVVWFLSARVMRMSMSSATLLFPTISVCSMLGALVAGFLVFREKLKLQQWLGFFLGVGAVFLLQL